MVENLPIYKEKGEVPLDPEFITPIGRADVAREGTDITIVAHSFATVRALHVAEKLAADHGVDAEVVDLRSLRPLDVETVAASVAKTNRVVCVEEGWPSYGVTAELAARIQKACFDDLDAPVERVGMAEVPLPYAKNLELAALPGEDRIEAAVLATLGLRCRRRSRSPAAPHSATLRAAPTPARQSLRAGPLTSRATRRALRSARRPPGSTKRTIASR